MSGVLAGLSLSPSWLRGEAWQDAPQRARDYLAGAGAVTVAQAAEAAGWDYLLKPDVPELERARAARGPEMLGPDAFALMSVIAGATRRVCLVPTCSTTFTPPYQLARALRSLDALSGGRAGWNAVWSLAGHGNFGMQSGADAQERLAAANATVAAVHDLWAGFPERALAADAVTGRFVRTETLTVGQAQVDAGVAGPLTLPGRARLPMLTAGGSPKLLEFAGRWADAVFVAAPTPANARRQADEVSACALAAGRAADAVDVHPGIIISARDRARPPLPSADGAGARHVVAAGTAELAAEQIAQYLDASGAPGFIALPFGGWQSLEITVHEVLPRVRQLLGGRFG